MASMAKHNALLKNGDASTKVLISQQHLIIKGQTVYHFEIVSLAISIAFIYLLISCTFRRVFSIIS